MSAMVHSEGPWRVDPTEPDEWFPADVNILRPDGLAVAVAVQNGDIEPDVAKGNAHLIAASLDMYVQLKIALGHIDHMAVWINSVNAGHARGLYSFESLGEDIESMRAAVRKATGGAA